MACDKSALEASACDNGFTQVAGNEQQFRALVLQLLCELTGGSGSGGFALYSGDYSGIAPGFSPTATTAIAFDTVTGTQWNWYSSAWH